VAGTVVVLPEVGGSVTGSVVGCSVCTELMEDVDGLLGTVAVGKTDVLTLGFKVGYS
jgi:predicted aconitase with swiveling domain